MSRGIFDPSRIKSIAQIIRFSPLCFQFLRSCLHHLHLQGLQDYCCKVRHLVESLSFSSDQVLKITVVLPERLEGKQAAMKEQPTDQIEKEIEPVWFLTSFSSEMNMSSAQVWQNWIGRRIMMMMMMITMIIFQDKHPLFNEYDHCSPSIGILHLNQFITSTSSDYPLSSREKHITCCTVGNGGLLVIAATEDCKIHVVATNYGNFLRSSSVHEHVGNDCEYDS